MMGMKVLFVLVFAMALFSGSGFGEDAPVLKVVSYNIHHGAGVDKKLDLERIAKLIAEQEPDLVALQEVDKNCKRSGNQDLAAELGRLTGMGLAFGKFMDFQGGEYGLAILSRLPILDTVRYQLPEGSEPRCSLEVKVEVEGLSEPLSFVCIHNDWKDDGIRVAQVEALLDGLKSHRNPIMLAGDFNGERSDASMELLREDGWEILEKNDGTLSKTFPSGEPRVEIDYFVIKGFPEVKVDHTVGKEKVASDHRPIHAVLEIVGE
jgi:endonuclease/exonuclease/phosphatase family metal-dependent hydrolase